MFETRLSVPVPEFGLDPLMSTKDTLIGTALSETTTLKTTRTLKWDKRFLDMAKLVASWSKDPSTQTGAVIVAPDMAVVSVGYNGFPKGMDDDPHIYANRPSKYSRIVHCEMNAVLQANQSVEGCTLYTYPFISCDRCMVHMVQAGITRCVAPRPTADQLERWADAFKLTREYAEEAGIELVELDDA